MPKKYSKNIGISEISGINDAGVLFGKKTTAYSIKSLSSNFQFLKQHDPVFYQLASAAEQFFNLDPNTTMAKREEQNRPLRP